MTPSRSEDYIDGLQKSYQILHKLFTQSQFPERRFAYQNAMSEINQEIEDVCHDKPRIITI